MPLSRKPTCLALPDNIVSNSFNMDSYQNQPQDLSTPELPAPHRHFFNKKFATTFFVLLALGGTALAGFWWWQQVQIANDDQSILDVPLVTTYAPTPPGQSCGGGPRPGGGDGCPSGYMCKVNSQEVDATGICVEEGQFCGGIAGLTCPSGYSCKYEGNYPDAAGACVKDMSTFNSDQDLMPLYSKFTWSASQAMSMKLSDIDYGGSTTVVSGVEFSANFLNTSSKQTQTQGLENYYSQKLTALGWAEDVNSEADGPNGSRWGYIKSGQHILFVADYPKNIITIFAEK